MNPSAAVTRTWPEPHTAAASSGLRPNPQLQAEMENFAGIGRVQGVRGLEATVQVESGPTWLLRALFRPGFRSGVLAVTGFQETLTCQFRPAQRWSCFRKHVNMIAAFTGQSSVGKSANQRFNADSWIVSE